MGGSVERSRNFKIKKITKCESKLKIKNLKEKITIKIRYFSEENNKEW